MDVKFEFIIPKSYVNIGLLWTHRYVLLFKSMIKMANYDIIFVTSRNNRISNIQNGGESYIDNKMGKESRIYNTHTFSFLFFLL